MAGRSGLRNDMYDLISVLYHAQQSQHHLSRFAEDAEEAGDLELATFFRELREDDRGRVERAMTLLEARRGPDLVSADDVVDEASKESFPASDAPAY